MTVALVVFFTMAVLSLLAILAALLWLAWTERSNAKVQVVDADGTEVTIGRLHPRCVKHFTDHRLDRMCEDCFWTCATGVDY